jgi:predicted Zn finger-like uncharacterized protein
MNVRCPSCRTVFRVDPAKIPEAGIRARCTVCAATMDVRRDGVGVERLAAPRPAEPAPPPDVGVGRERVTQAGPATSAESRPAAAAPPDVPESPAVGGPAPGPIRLSQPFSQPRSIAPAEAAPPAAPRRPAAPVFRPTPGRPVTAAPVPPTAEVTGGAAAVAPPPATPARPAPPPRHDVTKRPVNPFLHQDPQQKARRLARALVSDMIVYQPEKRQRALAAGNLREVFEDEIQKSWLEYVEQVGEELAGSTSYWNDALNEILAGGKQVF